MDISLLSGERTGPFSTRSPGNGKPLGAEGSHALVLLDVSPIVPASGLALAPWRFDQVAGRSAGQNLAPLWIRGEAYHHGIESDRGSLMIAPQVLQVILPLIPALTPLAAVPVRKTLALADQASSASGTRPCDRDIKERLPVRSDDTLTGYTSSRYGSLRWRSRASPARRLSGSFCKEGFPKALVGPLSRRSPRGSLTCWTTRRR